MKLSREQGETMKNENITEEERGILSIVRFNKLLKRKEIVKRIEVGRIRIGFRWQSKKNLWGRFGGGWNWCLGFEAGGNTLIFNILICTLRVDLLKKR